MHTFRQGTLTAFGLVSAACLAACGGTIDGASEDMPGTTGTRQGAGGQTGTGPGPGGSSTGPLPTDPSAVPPERMMSTVCKGVDPGPIYARRLTKREYNNTIRDLLQDTSQPARDFPTEQQVEGFDNNALAATVSPVLLEQYLVVADRVATAAVAKPAVLGLPAGCDTTNGTDACATTFIQTFGKKAFRRPVTPDEVTLIQGVYQAGKANGGFANGIRLAMMEMLMAPPFLYRIEYGAPAKAGETITRPDPYEMASRLSFLLWNSMPDPVLFDAAAANKLSAAADVMAQAQRMLGDKTRRSDVTNHFYEQWFDVDRMDQVMKDTTVYKTFSAALLPAMTQELLGFLEDLTWASNGDLPALFTAPFTYVNTQLATFYKVPAPTGTSFSKVMLDPQATHRAGLLTQGAILNVYAHANQTAPVLRGKFVREMLMCQRPPNPPNNIVIKLPDLSPTLSTRERFNMHSTDPNCAGCHTLMDPIGLGFEGYDGVGLYRTTENGKPIDTTGEIKGAFSGGDGHFNGVMELSNKLSTADEVRGCLAVKWFTYGYGRQQTDNDVCSLDVLKRTFAAGGYKLKDFLVALTQTDAFLYRRVIPPGGDQ
jgi:hypothetical protein